MAAKAKVAWSIVGVLAIVAGVSSGHPILADLCTSVDERVLLEARDDNPRCFMRFDDGQNWLAVRARAGCTSASARVECARPSRSRTRQAPITHAA
jgi:hypothetical protein